MSPEPELMCVGLERELSNESINKHLLGEKYVSGFECSLLWMQRALGTSELLQGSHSLRRSCQDLAPGCQPYLPNYSLNRFLGGGGLQTPQILHDQYKMIIFFLLYLLSLRALPSIQLPGPETMQAPSLPIYL